MGMENKIIPFSEQDIIDDFCEAIRSKGIKQKWIAQQMNLTEGYISSILKRRMKMTQDFRDKLNELLNTNI